MRRCSCFFLVLLLAAATAGSLAAPQKDVSEEEHVLQTPSSGTGLGLKQLPDESFENPQLPVRRAGAAPYRRGARLRLRRKRRADREARMVRKDPDNASDGLASGEPHLERNDAGNEEGEGNLRKAVELALRSKQVPQQGESASTAADEEDANPGRHGVPFRAGSKDPSLEDGKSGALARRAAALSKPTSKDSVTGIGGEQGDMTSPTSITAVQGQEVADSMPLKDVAKTAPQPVGSEASATALSNKNAAAQEAKAGSAKRAGRFGGRQKSSEPLPHDGGSQEENGDPGDLGKEHTYPALDAPDDEPYDSSQSAITLGRNSASESEAEDAARPTRKNPGDKAADGRGGKNPRQQSSAGEPQAGLDKEQLRDSVESSKEASKTPDKPPGKKPSAGRGGAGVKEDAGSGKVPGGGSKAGSAKPGSGAKSGSSRSSSAKIGNGEAAPGERTGGGAGADVAKSDEEPTGSVEGLRDAIALLQRGDVGDGVFELAVEDEEDDEETGGPGTRKGAAKNIKDRKEKIPQGQDKPAVSSSAKTADQNRNARDSRNEPSSIDKADREEIPGADRGKQSGADGAELQEKAGASKSEGRNAESVDRKEETKANISAEQSRESDRDGQPDQETEEEVRSVPRTFDRLLDHYKVASFLDVPCGDGDQVSNKVDHFPTSHPDDIRYFGVDSSEAAIDSAARVHGDTPNWSFHVQDYVHESLPKADLLVSRAALLRPDMLMLVDMLENFASSGAKYLLLGSFEELTFADPSISTESDQAGVESEGVPYLVSLQQEPFGLDAPLQVFSEPEGFGAKFGAAAISGSAAKTGEGSKGGKVGKSGTDAKSAKNGKSADGARAGAGASSEKNAASLDDDKPDGVNRQMLLYSGEYLMRQNFSLMRGRVELFIDAK